MLKIQIRCKLKYLVLGKIGQNSLGHLQDSKHYLQAEIEIVSWGGSGRSSFGCFQGL